ncbi:MAG: ABC transporter ATP-binding protein [Thermoplasmatota archaeon]
MSVSEAVIRINRLTKYYGKARGIIDVDLSVEKGEIFGFLGPNGAGKSTTIRTILDYIRPTSGSAMVNGMDPTKEGANVRRSVGYLPSDFGTYKSMTCRDYLETLLNMMEHKGSNRIEELSERFQLDLKRKIKEFSRGNRQKVGLVSAFMHSPELVILDEPTTGLDPLMQQEFYNLVREEKAKGNTVFLSSHILTEVEAICDRVGIIKEGKLIVVEKMRTFKEKTGKIMQVTFENDVSSDEFRKIDGITLVERTGKNELKITVAKNIDEVIKALAKHSVKDLDYEDMSLESLFLKYYEKDKKGKEAEK